MPRGRPKNPVTQKLKLDQARRSMIRSLRDRGLSEGYAQGMNVHSLADLFGKDTAGAFTRIKQLTTRDPSISTRRQNVLKANEIKGVKRTYNVSLETAKKREASQARTATKEALSAKNREGVERRNKIIFERYSQGAVGGELINGLGLSLVGAITIARKAAEENPLLEYKRAQALKRLREGGVYSAMSVGKALSWIREDLVTFGEGIARREHKVGRSVSDIRAEIGIKGKENMRKEVSPATFMQKNKFNSKTFEFLSNTFLASFDLSTKRPRNAFDVAARLRMRVPSLTESLIQSYSNWVYSFMQEKEGLQELIELRAKIQKELTTF